MRTIFIAGLVIVGLALTAFGCARDERSAATTPPPPPPAAEQEMPTGNTQGVAVQLQPTEGNVVTGSLTLTQASGDGVTLTGRVMGLAPNSEHGIHIHENGDCSAPDASSAGDHFNPSGNPHGAPGPTAHTGDMGNITANADGVAEIAVQTPGALEGGVATSIRGKSIVVHAARDDLTSQPSGNSGARVACGVIPG